MTPHPERAGRSAAGNGARGLILAGVLLNALLFVTIAAMALHYAFKNALTTYFMLVLMITACACAAAVVFFIALRRRRVLTLTAGRRTTGHKGTH